MLSSLPSFAPFFLALRNMRTRLGRTFLTLMGIVLGVAVILAINITNQSTLDSLRQVFDRATGSASLVVLPPDGEPSLDDAALARMSGVDGVLAAAPLVRAQTLLASEASSWELEFSVNGIAAGTILILQGIDPELDPQVRVYELTAGELPAAGRYEAALPQKYADEKGLKLGGDLVLLTSDSAGVASGVVRLEITALLADEGVALLNDGVVAFAPLSVVQSAYDRAGALDEIALRLDPAIAEDPRALEAFKEKLAERLGRFGRVEYPAARGQLVTQMLATYQLGLTFFSIIAIFVGAFLIYNTFSMTVVQRTRELGMLRAIGMTRWQILRLVLAEAVLLALLGSFIGLFGGIFMARGLMSLITGTLVTGGSDVLNIPLAGLLQSVVVGIGVTLGAALIPAISAARISPLEALRARGRANERVSPWVWGSGLALLFAGWFALYQLQWRYEVVFTAGSVSILVMLLGATLTVTLAVSGLERLTRPLAAALYGKEGELGSANINRSVGRTTLTVASLMIALTMIIGIGSTAYSFKQDMTAWIDTALGGDLYVNSAVLMRETFARQLASVPGVEALTPSNYMLVRVASASMINADTTSDSLTAHAIEPQTYRQVAGVEFGAGQGDLEANWARLAQGGAVFIATSVADRYHLKQGDSLTLLTARGEHSFYIAAEVVEFSSQGNTITITYADLHRWFNAQGVDQFIVKVAPTHPVEDVAAEIERRYGDRRHVSVQTTEAFKQDVRALSDQSFQLFDVLNIIGVIIGALGVVNTLTMNVMERQKEIGSLRSLGMTRRQVLRMVLAEALGLGVMGGLYGLVFGFVIANVLILGMNLMIGYDLAYLFTARPFLLGIFIALLVSQGAALLPARRAAAVNVVEAIKHE